MIALKGYKLIGPYRFIDLENMDRFIWFTETLDSEDQIKVFWSRRLWGSPKIGKEIEMPTEKTKVWKVSKIGGWD